MEQPAGNSLTDNSATPVTFPATDAGGSSSLTFTIKNLSTSGSLTVGAVTKDGANASDFTITQNPTNNGSGGLNFLVRFAPSSPGTRIATLHVDNTDCDENPFDIRLSGVGLGGGGGGSLSTLRNVSTRLPVGTGDNVLIAGFIIQGTQPKRRAIGPVLATQNVTGALRDPTLELHGPAGLIASNDDWPEQSSEIQATGILPATTWNRPLCARLPRELHSHRAGLQ